MGKNYMEFRAAIKFIGHDHQDNHTLIIFIYQTNLIRKQNYLSILPYLSISTSDNSGQLIFDFLG